MVHHSDPLRSTSLAESKYNTHTESDDYHSSKAIARGRGQCYTFY